MMEKQQTGTDVLQTAQRRMDTHAKERENQRSVQVHVGMDTRLSLNHVMMKTRLTMMDVRAVK